MTHQWTDRALRDARRNDSDGNHWHAQMRAALTDPARKAKRIGISDMHHRMIVATVDVPLRSRSAAMVQKFYEYNT